MRLFYNLCTGILQSGVLLIRSRFVDSFQFVGLRIGLLNILKRHWIFKIIVIFFLSSSLRTPFLSNLKLSIMSLSSKTAFLAYLARLNPRLWEIIHPHVPKVSIGTRDVMAAMVIKAIVPEINDAKIAKELQAMGKRLFTAGTKAMSYEDDDWCPTRPRPMPFPDPIPWMSLFSGIEDSMLNPQPLPPREHRYYGGLLTVLSEAVSQKEIATSLQRIGTALLDGKVTK